MLLSEISKAVTEKSPLPGEWLFFADEDQRIVEVTYSYESGGYSYMADSNDPLVLAVLAAASSAARYGGKAIDDFVAIERVISDMEEGQVFVSNLDQSPQYMVTAHAGGPEYHVALATREHPGARWSPPISLTPAP